MKALIFRQAISASNKTDSKGAGGDEDATVNAMVVYIFEAGRAFQAENDIGMADRVECIVKYDRGNRCERWHTSGHGLRYAYENLEPQSDRAISTVFPNPLHGANLNSVRSRLLKIAFSVLGPILRDFTLSCFGNMSL